MITSAFDKETINLYHEDFCFKLAKALHEDSGLPLVALAYNRSDDLEDIDWCHILVKYDDDFLDIKGLRTFDDLKEDWGLPGKQLFIIDISNNDELEALVGEEISLSIDDKEIADELLSLI